MELPPAESTSMHQAANSINDENKIGQILVIQKCVKKPAEHIRVKHVKLHILGHV